MPHTHTQHTQSKSSSSSQPPKQQKRRTMKESDVFQIPEKYYEAARLIAALTEPSAAQRLSIREVDNINSKASELELLKVDAEIKFSNSQEEIEGIRELLKAYGHTEINDDDDENEKKRKTAILNEIEALKKENKKIKMDMRYTEKRISEKAQELITSVQGYKAKIGL